MEKVHVIGGGTVFHVRPHLSLSAVAYGTTARKINYLCQQLMPDRVTQLHLTKMANSGEGSLETNDDISKLIDGLVADPETKVVFLNAALCDYEGQIARGIDSFGFIPITTPSGKDQPRLLSRDGNQLMNLTPADKLIGKIRKDRKDIFLVGFKTTAGATEDEQYLAGLNLLKSTSCNLVLVNDVHTRLNIIVASELARYAVTNNRNLALDELVKMTNSRSRLSFTRTTMVDGNLIPWDSYQVPQILRSVVDWCADNKAYKPFRNVTVGHFAFRSEKDVLISSRRKMNYTIRNNRDLVKVRFTDDEMFAFGAKPSAGSRSQYAVLSQFPEYDCIVHFHCPMKAGSPITVRSQKELECGSHECGENTWKGITKFGNIAAVMLDKHGPNIIFSSKGNTQEVIDFIAANFDLDVRSDGMRE